MRHFLHRFSQRHGKTAWQLRAGSRGGAPELRLSRQHPGTRKHDRARRAAGGRRRADRHLTPVYGAAGSAAGHLRHRRPRPVGRAIQGHTGARRQREPARATGTAAGHAQRPAGRRRTDPDRPGNRTGRTATSPRPPGNWASAVASWRTAWRNAAPVRRRARRRSTNSARPGRRGCERSRQNSVADQASGSIDTSSRRRSRRSRVTCAANGRGGSATVPRTASRRRRRQRRGRRQRLTGAAHSRRGPGQYSIRSSVISNDAQRSTGRRPRTASTLAPGTSSPRNSSVRCMFSGATAKPPQRRWHQAASRPSSACTAGGGSRAKNRRPAAAIRSASAPASMASCSVAPASSAGRHVIQHHAKATADLAVQRADRPGLQDVEGAKQRESGQVMGPGQRHRQQRRGPCPPPRPRRWRSGRIPPGAARRCRSTTRRPD